MGVRLFLALAFAVLLPALAAAQGATLVADKISVEADSALVAEGNVEVFFEGSQLTATRVRYDRNGELLIIDGPIRIVQPDGSVVIASSAELDGTLRQGLMRSARLVLERQLQFAAAEIKTGDRFTRLSRVTASSCTICENGETPLWELRASRVIRDTLEQQLYFDNAQFRVLGVPVFYLPRLRLPDPTVDRATGFVIPEIRSRTDLGLGIAIPYFITIGPHADLTFGPYISSETRTLEAQYRQEIAGGRFSFEAALSDDELRPGETRGYLFAEGRYSLPRDYNLSFDLQLVSDDEYLFDYGVFERDRLSSGINLDRVRDDKVVSANVTSFRTLRGSELLIEDTLPTEIAQFEYAERVFESPEFGQAWLEVNGVALRRQSNAPVQGRDIGRLSFSANWQANRIFPQGFVANAEAQINADYYAVDEDPNFASTLQRITPAASVSLTWPHERRDPDGVRHLLEPTIQLAWANSSGDTPPNEDSTIVEFDEGNLFALSRFPGEDRREEGLRLNIGGTWTRYDPDGWSLGMTLGRVLRFGGAGQFGFDTGLSGDLSDWLVAANLRVDDRLRLRSRVLIEENLEVSRAETRAEWRTPRFNLAGTHLWRSAVPQENLFDDLSEITLATSYFVNDNWRASGNWRYDIDAAETTRAGVGLLYQNECVGVDLSLSRRFTTSTNVAPVTEFDLRVFLTGFGTGGDPRRARRSCAR
jgi:LPS-assembly protein